MQSHSPPPAPDVWLDDQRWPLSRGVCCRPGQGPTPPQTCCGQKPHSNPTATPQQEKEAHLARSGHFIPEVRQPCGYLPAGSAGGLCGLRGGAAGGALFRQLLLGPPRAQMAFPRPQIQKPRGIDPVVSVRLNSFREWLPDQTVTRVPTLPRWGPK